MNSDVDVQAVPLVDLAAQQAEIHDEVMAELDTVLSSASFIGGPAVASFEAAYASFLGARHCAGVANGTDALELALRAGGVRPGGEVILPANTFIATAEAVSRIGAVPVPVDVDPSYLLIDPDAVAAAVTSRTQAIVPVHLFGQTAFVEQLIPVADSCGAVIIEDAAQSQGATRFGRHAGTWGLAAGTSFYPGKNLGAAGDAGAVLTSDPDVDAQVRLLGAHGSSVKYRHDAIGFNSRLDTVQAVVLKAKLARLQGWNLRRRAAAERYAALLADVPGVELPREAPGNADVWHLYVVRVQHRDAVLESLHAAGIQAGIHYPVPVHRSGAYAGRTIGSFPVAEEAAGRILSLPLFPHITAEQQERVAGALSCAVAKP
ncbi:DegT/DnrJ/EryC1/StrS family aminotransferase [Arthrobacter sp. SLBN-112]|uniref:DegT/DnrJ/EryC1/StrS family aminotransferase n=1 Tax=Arthrobacter sp. SLBN-112 TaxID=2768452 RepID=UPI0027ADD3EA|nr:DegT/DnrJ/EryC1/StrS family aminotransferase [Arthrobacter sp. SLBN-112]MDQ0799163.1 dTDP-4-amino-4,6-dideoxygalactose transaminase [Arthrobacter sp. SLBN-112]